MRAAAPLAVLLALGLGFVVGHWLVPRDAPATAPPPAVLPPGGAASERTLDFPDPEGTDVALRDPAPGAALAPAGKRPSGDAAPDPIPRDLLEDVDGRLVEAEVARRAAARRAQLRSAYEGAEEAARAQVLADIARERERLADLERGGPIAMLEKLEDDWAPPWELLNEPKRYTALFEPRTRGGVIDARTVDRSTALADGDALRYGPGRHELDVRSWLNRMRPFPQDLAIEGYGMDQTLLVLNGDLSMRGDVQALTFRDLTIDCDGHYLEDLRNRPYTLRLERCRVVGFHSDMLGGRVGAFYATDCRFESGYGRSRGGNLFDVRRAFVARLENCTILGPFNSVYYRWSGAAVLFERCRFEAMAPRTKQHLEEPHRSVRFVDCTFAYLDHDRAVKRALSDLNPAWAE